MNDPRESMEGASLLGSSPGRYSMFRNGWGIAWRGLPGIAGLLVESRAPPARLDGRDARPSALISYLRRFFFFVPQPLDKHLFFWFVVIHE
jgi:hypothetical protein